MIAISIKTYTNDVELVGHVSLYYTITTILKSDACKDAARSKILVAIDLPVARCHLRCSFELCLANGVLARQGSDNILEYAIR